jgi:hypothetical protein
MPGSAENIANESGTNAVTAAREWASRLGVESNPLCVILAICACITALFVTSLPWMRDNPKLCKPCLCGGGETPFAYSPAPSLRSRQHCAYQCLDNLARCLVFGATAADCRVSHRWSDDIHSLLCCIPNLASCRGKMAAYRVERLEAQSNPVEGQAMNGLWRMAVTSAPGVRLFFCTHSSVALEEQPNVTMLKSPSVTLARPNLCFLLWILARDWLWIVGMSV